MCHDMTRYLSCLISVWGFDKLLAGPRIISFNSSHIMAEHREAQRDCRFYLNLKDFVTNLWTLPYALHGLLRSFLVTDRARPCVRSTSSCTRSEILQPHAFFMWPFNIVWTKMKAEDSNRSQHLYITSKRSSATFSTYLLYQQVSSEALQTKVIKNMWLSCTTCFVSHTPTAASWWHHLYSALNV